MAGTRSYRFKTTYRRRYYPVVYKSQKTYTRKAYTRRSSYRKGTIRKRSSRVKSRQPSDEDVAVLAMLLHEETRPKRRYRVASKRVEAPLAIQDVERSRPSTPEGHVAKWHMTAETQSLEDVDDDDADL